MSLFFSVKEREGLGAGRNEVRSEVRSAVRDGTDKLIRHSFLRFNGMYGVGPPWDPTSPADVGAATHIPCRHDSSTILLVINSVERDDNGK